VVACEQDRHVRADDLELWPLSGLWVIGIFVGIDLLLYSWWLVSLRMGKFEARNPKFEIVLNDNKDKNFKQAFRNFVIRI